MQLTDKNLAYTCYVQNKDNNRNNMKIYIYRQTTILLQILSKKRKNRMKLNLAIINIEYHIPSRNDNGNDLKTDDHRQTIIPL